MNNESNITVDSLSYKELQGLAMSLNLPGKMKQGVLVEAIKARQNNNEPAVAMILEANRQRRIAKRQHQLEQQQQQLTKLHNDKLITSKRSCVTATKAKIKRSASEMDQEIPFIDQEGFKRSKLAAALIQQRRPPYFNSYTTVTSASMTSIRKEHHTTYQSTQTTGGCSSTWDSHSVLESSCHLLPQPITNFQKPLADLNFQKPLPDLSKDPSILPSLSDCSSNNNSSVATPSTNEDLGCCSVSTGPSSNWSNMSSSAEQPLPQSSYESCDSGWIGTDDSYDLNTWKNESSSSMAPSSNNSSGFFEDQSANDVFANEGCDVYRSDDFISHSAGMNATCPNYNNDYQPLVQSLDSTFQEQNNRPDPWSSEPVAQPHFNQLLPPNQVQVMHSSGHSSTTADSLRVANDWCYDVDCYQQGGPYFRIQRPGNPTAVFVPSGRSLTLSTFCNMLPRVASYVQ